MDVPQTHRFKLVHGTGRVRQTPPGQEGGRPPAFWDVSSAQQPAGCLFTGPQLLLDVLVPRDATDVLLVFISSFSIKLIVLPGMEPTTRAALVSVL